MGAHAVIKHALNQGVTLRKAMDTPMPGVPARGPDAVVYRPTVIIAGVPVWSRVWETPLSTVRVWITDALTEGDYAYAAHLSAYVHAAPVLLEGAVILPAL